MAKRKHEQQPEIVRRDGGLCAAFVNTACGKRKGFSTYADLLARGMESGTLTTAAAERLERAAAERPEAAAAVVRRALDVRSCLRRVLLTAARRKPIAAADLEALNGELRGASAARCLVAADSGCRWAWGDRDGDELDRMLWPVLESAADVLASRDHLKVRLCAGEGCGILFVDRTPGSPRKWCSMRACGARVKAHRHYHRKVKPERAMIKRLIAKERAARFRARREAERSKGLQEKA